METKIPTLDAVIEDNAEAEVAELEEVKIEDDLEDIPNKDDLDADVEATVKKARKKRRTKEEIDGRNFNCHLCEKAYLSYPALTNHRKAKHPTLNHPEFDFQTDLEKKRGRPRKMIQSSVHFSEYQNKIKNFFENYKRKTNVEISSNELNTYLSEIKMKIQDEVSLSVSGPILDALMITDETETDNNSSSKNKTIDEVLIKFIKNSMIKTNPEYLRKLIIHCLHFRESINKSKQDNFTSTESSELIPEMSNYFISHIKGLNLEEEDLIDSVEYIQHFCHWCQINKYTNSKLSLLLKCS